MASKAPVGFKDIISCPKESLKLFYTTFSLDVNVVCFFYSLTWAGLQRVIVALPGHTHLLLDFSVMIRCIS